MRKITKETCMVFIKNYHKSTLVRCFLGFVFAALAVWFLTKNIIATVIVSVLLSAVLIFMIYTANKKIKNIDLDSFYLAEDSLADFKRRINFSKAAGSGFDHVYTFRNHGKYTIYKSVYPTIKVTLHKKNNVDSETTVDDLCLQSCEKGDVFYLLITKGKKREKIIRCFPRYNFDILKEDFDLADGKYYCKK